MTRRPLCRARRLNFEMHPVKLSITRVEIPVGYAIGFELEHFNRFHANQISSQEG